MLEVPILAEYDNYWPAIDVMKTYLKNTKARLSKAKGKQKERVLESEDE